MLISTQGSQKFQTWNITHTLRYLDEHSGSITAVSVKSTTESKNRISDGEERSKWGQRWAGKDNGERCMDLKQRKSKGRKCEGQHGLLQVNVNIDLINT